MRAVLLCCVFLMCVVGCRLPPDREPFKPLPENGAQFSYGELLARLHGQANSAMDAFFVDSWTDLEEAGRGIGQTARFLVKATDPPERFRATLPVNTVTLQKQALRLAEAAREKNVDVATDALQHISLQIRLLKTRD